MRHSKKKSWNQKQPKRASGAINPHAPVVRHFNKCILEKKLDLMIQSTVEQTVEGGVLLSVTADDLRVQAYVVMAPLDLTIVEKLVPATVFESGAQVHVAGIQQTNDVFEEIIQILENMSPSDVVVYLCEDALVYGEALSVLGIKH